MAELPKTAITHSRKNKPAEGSQIDALRLRRRSASLRGEAVLFLLADLTSP
jgi:hypothetical protein